MSNQNLNSQVQVDEEDLTVQNNLLKFKDRAYDPGNFSGLGRHILRKNILNGANVLTQIVINKENTVYEIRYDFDLKGGTITIPKGCILDFQGGSIQNGTINFNKCYIKAVPKCIFPNIKVQGYVLNEEIYAAWFEREGNENDSEDIQQALNLAIRNDIIKSEVKTVSGYRKDKTTKIIYLTPDKNYFITKSLYLYPGVSIDGKFARLAPKNFTDPIICQNINEEGIILAYASAYSEIKNIHFDNSGYVGNPSPNGAYGIKFAGYVNINNLIFDNFTKEIAGDGNQYIDGITIDSITMYSHHGAEPIIKIYQGDRTRINGINGPHNINIELGQCHGGEISNCIGVGVIAKYCNSLTISNMHVERGNTSYQAYFEFLGTVATLKDSILYERNIANQYAIKVKTDNTNIASVITLNNVGIIHDEDYDLAVDNLNDIYCDRRSSIIFNMCYANYQPLGSTSGFIGVFMAPTIYSETEGKKVLIDKINTLNGIYSGGKFREFTRELTVASQEMIASVSLNSDAKNRNNGLFANTGIYEYYIIPLVSGSRHIGYSKGSLRVSYDVKQTNQVLNISLNFWGANDNYLNNIVRICRYHVPKKTLQYIDFISLGRLSNSLVDMGAKIKNLGEWINYDNPIIMEGSKCTISDKNIIATVENITNVNQLQTKSFANGDIIESGKNTYYFSNGKWEGKGAGYLLSSDSISGDLSGWVNFFTLKKNTNLWLRKSMLISLSSSYHGGISCTAIINVPSGGDCVPYVVSFGKNHHQEIKLAYKYDNTYLRLYIHAGNNRCHSVKVLQSDVSSDLYNLNVSAVALPSESTEFWNSNRITSL